MTETHTRTLTRAVTWRITATAVTALWTGIEGAIVINLFMTVAHYAHERLWLRLKWGTAYDKTTGSGTADPDRLQ